MFKALRTWLDGAPIVFFHEFHKPPYGGGNQFLLALKAELERRGVPVGVNRVGPKTKVVLFNSYNFDFEKLKSVPRGRVRLVHRVDGPIGVYRGQDDGTDQKIWQVNHDFADATIFQSHYSMQKHADLGMNFNDATVIPNAVDPKIFYPLRHRPTHERTKLIATSWSDNPLKGGPVYEWLDKHLDFSRYSLTFVGRTKAKLKNATVIDPVPSEEVARLLRDHDIYLTASQHDPCSNALIEALSCGLPALYRKSGGHPELVKGAGLGFSEQEEIPELLEDLTRNYAAHRAAIDVMRIEEVGSRYLEVLRAAENP